MSEQRTERHVRVTCISRRPSLHGDGEALWAPCICGDRVGKGETKAEVAMNDGVGEGPGKCVQVPA